ncbi:AAA family ATPase [uncultured Leptotrichia sp.]|jgi:hypothetical protein|uniref:ATP-dependent nuclease n=1 Tax=uncultured Leptotrichia sp. TaxID=159271 RepID=UPI002636EB82|nr:AAA family ATPase [uncultured Leptotrichia sp.]
MSYYKELKILGFRGFSQECKIEFAIPNQKEEGSGLTILMGENNSGKTSILEALRMIDIAKSNGNQIEISEGKRNRINGSSVKITLITEKEEEIVLTTEDDSPSAKLKFEKEIMNKNNIYALKSKREMLTFDYTSNGPLSKKQIREYSLDRDSHSNRVREMFWSRLKDIEKKNKKKEYSELIDAIIGKKLEWVLEVNDAEQNYIKYKINEKENHNSEGIGDGIINVFFLAEKLFESEKGDLIVIDEPELSLHPSLQKNVLKKLLKVSKDRQIIISTHSPYFIDSKAIINGAKLIRIVKEEEGIECYSLNNVEIFKKSMENFSNPHILGLVAKEIFFSGDKIILVEGQEDVVYYKKIFDEFINVDTENDLKEKTEKVKNFLFGWGCGGAENARNILEMFREFGYKKIFCILDGDKKDKMEGLKKEYPEYRFTTISKDDIRDKKGKLKKKEIEIIFGIFNSEKDENKRRRLEDLGSKEGLLKENGDFKNNESKEEMKELILCMYDYFFEKQ